MDTVSVLTPIYNGASKLARYRDNLSQQTRQPDEILILDDGSTDDTPLLLAEWAAQEPRLRYINHTSNMGRGAARQTLLDNVTTTHVSWLDVDDLWNPKKLEIQAAELERINNIGKNMLVAGPYEQVSIRHGGSRKFELPHIYALEDYLHLAERNQPVVMLQTVYGRTSTFKMAQFDRSLNWSEDFDYFLRFLSAGGGISPLNVPDATCIYMHDIRSADPHEIIKAHDHIYSTHKDLWDDEKGALKELHLRRLKYVIYALSANKDPSTAERVYWEAVTHLQASHHPRAQSAANTILRHYRDEPDRQIGFAHSVSNIARRVTCQRVTDGYLGSSGHGVRMRWKRTAGSTGSVAIGAEGYLADDEVMREYAAGNREVELVERIDNGRTRRFNIRPLSGGQIAIVPRDSWIKV